MIAEALITLLVFAGLALNLRKREHYIRGERIQKKHRGKRDPNAVYQWGTARLGFEEARRHFCVVGSTGSGKTLAILLLLKSVVRQLVKKRNGRVLIYDGKTDLLPLIRGADVPEDQITILNPFDARASAWRIADDVTTSAQADDVAACLIPKAGGESSPYFTDTARRLLAGIIEALIYNAPRNWTLRDVILSSKTQERLGSILASCPDTVDLLEHFEPHSTFRNVKSLLDGCLRGYAPIAAAWQEAETDGRTFSVSNWINGEGVLVLGNHTKAKEAISRLNTVVFSEMAKQLLSRPGKVDSETWLFLDEFRELGKLPHITDLMITGRSKGAAIVLGFQCVAGLDSLYGRELSREILGCAQNLAVLHINSSQPDTRRWASDVLGEHIIRREEMSESQSMGKGGFSRSGSTSYRTVSEKIWLPSQFTSELPPASLAHGLSGVFRSGTTFVKTRIKGKKLFARSASPLSLPPAADFPEFEERSREAQQKSLKDWSEIDRIRIGILDKGKKEPIESIHPVLSHFR